jgi:Ca2+/H+ antiporter
MSKKSRLFLLFACIALVVTMLRFIHSITIPEDVVDFSAGFAVAMLVGYDGDME